MYSLNNHSKLPVEVKLWKVTGIEASPLAGNQAGNLEHPVHTGLLEEAPEPVNKYNLTDRGSLSL
ncbi:hypothetical protein EYB53_016470 [Candidatus Chloroploca sp. M-50]|uniref:Uncharacterized protein n=1 Tax=Candidatus Chloroploca mongolica TaxID=2528176 RepID=A0ABS4DDA9_9CHLR|nr:hypothetical protein [Candidatus Chloroploca mongolica]MBP1467309.1 hypothetical protein [Candidatus Chloroploca mongolica]